MIDLVTVHYDEKTRDKSAQLRAELKFNEPTLKLTEWSNEEANIGFGPAVNKAASNLNGEILGLLNPDTRVLDRFVSQVINAFKDPNLVICGNRYGKPKYEIDMWGCKDWVCGATFFVRKDWWNQVGGFDPAYIWAWEETDLIRLAEQQGRGVRSLNLSIDHESPRDDSVKVQKYKYRHMILGHHHFNKKWKCKCLPPSLSLLEHLATE